MKPFPTEAYLYLHVFTCICMYVYMHMKPFPTEAYLYLHVFTCICMYV